MRSGSRKIRTKFTTSSLTHFGGIYLLHQFLQQLRLRTFLSNYLKFPQRNNHYSTTELLLALIYPMILGLDKIEVSALLGTNGVFQYITGLPAFPNPTTLRRFLSRAADPLFEQLASTHDRLRRYFLSASSTSWSFWLDCDSTTQTLYGHQEGAMVGYNPHHRGKKSYHPSIITEAHRGDCLAGRLRPGNAHTAEGIDDLLRRATSLLPAIHRLRVRADAGFYSGSFVSLLKELKAEFAVVAHLTSTVRRILETRRYARVSSIFSTAEFSYRPHGWKEPERFVVLRRKLPNQEAASQTTLFTLDRHAYSVVVTNLNLTPYGVFRFYQDRSAMERIVRTLKEDYPLGKAATNSFQANAFYTEVSLLAYNLITWFKRMCLPTDWHSFTLPTIRHRLLMIPGEFVRSHNVPVLRFPKNNPYQNIFEYAQQQIGRLEALI